MRRMLGFLSFVVAGVFLSCAMSADQPPNTASVSASVPVAKTLPGLPLTVRIDVNNSSEDVVFLRGVVTVTPEARDSFDLGWSGVPDVFDDQEPGPNGMPQATVPAHTNRQFSTTLAVPTLIGGVLGQISDAEAYRITMPGQYTARLRLLTGAGRFVESNLVRFEILAPQGEDLAVWNYMLNETGGKGWTGADWATRGFALAGYIRSEHPSSRYYQWTSLLAPPAPGIEETEFIEKTVANSDDPVFKEEATLFLANRHRRLSTQLTSEGRLNEGAEHAEIARRLLKDLASHAESAFVRASASATLEKVLSQQELRNRLSDMQGAQDHAQPVVGRVACVTQQPDGSFVAWFAYSNPNTTRVTLPIGEANKLTPAPHDRGQPTTFQPGDHSLAFSVTSKQPVTWHFDGEQIRASADFAAICVTP